MNSSANVKSIEVLVALRNALLRFKSEAQQALSGADSEIRHTREWLEERQNFWQKQLQMRRQRLQEAQKALQRCMDTVYRDPQGGMHRPDCSQYQAAVSHAVRAVREAEQEQAMVVKHKRHIEEAIQRYQHTASAFSNTLQGDLVKGTNMLQESVRILSAYTGKGLANVATGLIGGIIGLRAGTGQTSFTAIPTHFPGAHSAHISTPGGFIEPFTLHEHANRHAGSTGATSPEDYLQRAVAFMSGSPSSGVLQLQRTNGDIVRWNTLTGDFGIVTTNGVIRTYYNIANRSDPLDYFLRQYW